MTATRLLQAQLCVLVVLMGLVYYGLLHDFLWNVTWYSATAHFLGGFWVALGTAWILSVRRIPFSIVMCVLGAFSIGVCWEVFEFVEGATHFPADTVDTVVDLCMDIVGGVSAALLTHLWLRK